MKIFGKKIKLLRLTLIIISLVFLFFYLNSKKNPKILSSFVKEFFPENSDLVKGIKDAVPPKVPTLPPEMVNGIFQKSNDLLEQSPISEPVKEIKQEIKEKIERIVVESTQQIKELPAREIKIIQREICKQWLGEEFISTSSGDQNGGN